MTTFRTGFVLALAPLVLMTVVAGCARREQALIFDDSVATNMENAVNQRDADALAEVLDTDVQLLPPNSPVIDGHGEAKAFFREQFEYTGASTTKWDVRDLIVFNDYTYRQGIYQTDLPTGETRYGKFVHLWKNHPNGWKLYRAMWSSSESTLTQPAPSSN